jgi:hypothetical protein
MGKNSEGNIRIFAASFWEGAMKGQSHFHIQPSHLNDVLNTVRNRINRFSGLEKLILVYISPNIVYFVYNDAVSSSDSTVSNGRMVIEQCIGKDAERSWCALILCNYSGICLEGLRKTTEKVRIVSIPAHIEIGTHLLNTRKKCYRAHKTHIVYPFCVVSSHQHLDLPSGVFRPVFCFRSWPSLGFCISVYWSPVQ